MESIYTTRDSDTSKASSGYQLNRDEDLGIIRAQGLQDAYLHVASFVLGEAFVTEAMHVAISVASVEATPVA